MDIRWKADYMGFSLKDYDIRKNKWYRNGLAFRRHPATLHFGGAFGKGAIGYFGYAAGPDKYIIDYLALSDPFLAHLPAPHMATATSGHFHRIQPQGYLVSLRHDKNLIEDPSLRIYYEKIRHITQGPLFSLERLRDTFHMNTGRYRYLLDEYTAMVKKLKHLDSGIRKANYKRGGPVMSAMHDQSAKPPSQNGNRE